MLLHRGYPIGQLAEHSSFMEVSYLLLNGELPSQGELDEFTYTITRHTMLHEQGCHSIAIRISRNAPHKRHDGLEGFSREDGCCHESLIGSFAAEGNDEIICTRVRIPSR